jgi:hypothetical protein
MACARAWLLDSGYSPLTHSSPPNLTVRRRPAGARLHGTQLDKIHNSCPAA